MSLINKIILLTIFSITTTQSQIFSQNHVDPDIYNENSKYIEKYITKEKIFEVMEKFGEYIDPDDYEMLIFFIKSNHYEILYLKSNEWFEFFEELDRKSQEKKEEFLAKEKVKSKQKHEENNNGLEEKKV